MSRIKHLIAIASFVVAVIMSFVALLLPPPGVIDQSVLLLIAQFLILTATLLGVSSYVESIKKLRKE